MLSFKVEKTIHYELHGQTGNRWTMLEVFDDKDEATKQAEKVFRTGAYRSIRLLRERYDQEQGEFNSLEILFLGRKIKPSKYDNDELAIFCNSPADLYNLSSRRAMARLFAPVLDAMDITPVEILHNLDHYTRLQASGTHLMNAVQRLAIAQVRHTGEAVSERMRILFSLIDHAVTRLQQTRQAGVPHLNKGHFADLLDILETNKDRSYFLAIAIAEDLGTYQNCLAKMERLVGMLRFDHPDWARHVLDLFLSEQIQHRRLLRTLLPADDLVDLLGHILALSEGRLTSENNAAVATLNTFLGANILPATKAMLIGHIQHELATRNRITGDDLSKEFAALHHLNDIMGDTLDTESPDRPLTEQLADRIARLLNPQTLGDYLADGRNPANRLQRLIVLERHCISAANRRTLVNYMLPLLYDSANESFWLDPVGAGYAGHMRLLARLQKRILASGLQDLHKAKLSSRLDELCVALLEKSKILARLDKADAPVFDKGCKILTMLADRHFTKGNCDHIVKTQMHHYLADPAFIGHITCMPKSAERSRAADRLGTLLEKAGFDRPNTAI